MSGVQILKVEDRQWLVVGEAMAEDRRSYLSDSELLATACVHQPGSEDRPQLLQIRFPPNAVVNPHAHDGNEIIYVLEGEMRLGTEILRAGSSLAVAGQTIYGFHAGPEGLCILNFRPTMDVSYVSRGEMLDRRRAR
jgi:quercetin dioxygenase-like cupin family protein